MVLLVARRWRRVPSPLLLLVVASVTVALFGLDDHGIAVVGSVPSGLAGPANPPWSLHDVQVLLPTAFAITLISILEAMSLARDFADEHGYDVDPNQEITALGASNVSAGFFQGMVVTSAITRSSILDEAGARTQLSGALSPLIVAPLLIFGTVTFEDIPITVLAAIVIVAVAPFIKVGEARRLWRVQRSDFWVAMLSRRHDLMGSKWACSRCASIPICTGEPPTARAPPPPPSTADHQLRKLATRYRERGVQLLLVNVDDEVREVMDASGLTELIGPDHFFATDADAVAHLDARHP